MASNSQSYLTEAQKRSIIRSTTDLLATETINEIKRFSNLSKLNNELKKLGKVIEQQGKIYYTYINKSADALRLSYTVEEKDKEGKERERTHIFSQYKKDVKVNKEKLMTSLSKAYVLIMMLREVLLNEKISYHIYIGNDFGDTQAVTLGDKSILDLMYFSGNQFSTIQIGNKKIDELKNSAEKDFINIDELLSDMEVRSAIYQQFMPKIIAEDFEISTSSGQKLYKINYDVIDKDSSISDVYKRQMFKKGTKDISHKNRERSRNAFNRGHLAEAFDIAFDSLGIVSEQAYSYDELRNPPFYKNLVYDNVKATRGGDNSVRLEQQFSVKAYSANLYNISTLYGDLVELTSMIDLVLSQDEGNKTRVKEHLYNMFIDDSKFTNELGVVSTNEINKLLEDALSVLYNSI